jgi:hypothetical protein
MQRLPPFAVEQRPVAVVCRADLAGSAKSRCRAERFEPFCQAVAIGTIALSGWQMQGAQVQRFERFKHRAIVLGAQPFRDVNAKVGIDAYEMRIECCVVDLGKRNAVGHNGLAQALMAIVDDVGCIEQERLRQAGQRTAPAVGCDDSVAERRLM